MIKKILRHIMYSLFKNKKFRELVFDSSDTNTLLLADCGQEKFIVNSSDKFIGRYCYIFKRAFDVDKLNLAFSLLPDTKHKRTLIDIGANIGTICIHAAINNLVERCVAFEPEPNNFRLLSANLVLNNVNDKISAFNLALSNGLSQSLTFELSESNFGDHRVRTTESVGHYNEQERKTIQVQAKKLDDCISGVDQSTHIVWMDTQGFEGFVLDGAKNIIQKSVPIVTEFWPYGLERAQSFDLFVKSILGASYKTIIDLEYPDQKMDSSKETLKFLKEKYAKETKFTDLLIM